ncbi:hypothetical protein Goklo_020335 [Gossypium klotzschianum]|uniref:Cytochrome P450 n=1 Tax=Gossypium klotzschianum TaxID=34286 RepID=A0A7J8URY2_9ROSI|nr:hypothetical protein [Gossypium klotzschianum]
MIMDLASGLPAIVVGSLGLFILYNLWWTICSHKTEGKLLVRQPSGALPFIGHLHLLLAQQTGARTLAALADKYGPVFTIRLGTYLAYDHAGFGFASYGAYWLEIRKLAVVELFSVHRLALLKQVLNQNISVGPRLEVLVVNMMVRMIAGKRYFTGADGEVHEEAKRLIKLIKEFASVLATTAVSEVFPFLKWMDRWSNQVKSMKRISKEMESLIETWVNEHKLKKLKTEENNSNQDFIDVMLSTIKDGHAMSGHAREKIIKATITMLIIAGIDTTAIAMTWILSNLMNNRQALKRAQQELDLKIGRDRWAEDSDMEKLNYLQAIIKETFRLYPPVPMLMPHVLREDCCVSGYHIPQGTRLFVNAWKLHRDPRVWSNPEEFEPERFLTSHRNVDVLGRNFELTPFGSGRRSCPGIKWTLQAVHLTMARLLQGFDLTTPLDAPVDMTEAQGASATMPKATPLELVLTPCLLPHLYHL